jgi:hypothetical protein
MADDYQTFTITGSEDAQEYRVANKLELRYSEANGNEPDTLLVMQPVVSGFELSQPDCPKPFAVLEDEFYDVFTTVGL